MNAPARTTQATLILRNAAGEPPLGIGGLAFRDDQGEMFWPHDQAYQTPATRIGVLELENGEWLAHPPGFLVDGIRFDTRDAALRTAIARVIRKARRFMRAKDGEGTSWSEGFAGRVIEWAMSIKPEKNALFNKSEDSEQNLNTAIGESSEPTPSPSNLFEHGARNNDGSPVAITDPIVAGLIAAKRARQVWPAGHTFSRTNPIINGAMKNVATCECGIVFEFKWGCYELVDAAEESHWQSFDDLPEKVDGRGFPINAEKRAAERNRPGFDLAKKRSRRSAPKAGDNPELANAALPEPASVTPCVEGAGSPESQPGTGGQSSVPYLADGASSPPLRERGPAPDAPPDGAGSTISALRAIAAGEQVDWLIVRGLVGDGLAHATTTRLCLTEAGEALLKSSDGGGESGPAECPQDRSCAREPEAGDTASSGQAIIAGVAPGPSEADRLDWEALWSIAWGLPLDEVIAGDMLARGLIFVIDLRDLSRGYTPTKAGAARVEALKPLFDLDETRKKLGIETWEERRAAALAKQAAPIGAGSVADVKCEACEPTQVYAGSGLTVDYADPPTTEQMQQIEALVRPEFESPGWIDVESEADDDLAIEWPSYAAFLEDKIVTAPLRGIEVNRDSLHPWLKPHCKDLTLWALRLGCAAIFANFGLHKTAMQLEWCRQLHKHVGGATLNVVPLGVRHGFIKEALQLTMDVRFIRTNAEFHALSAEGVVHFLTNYESIREGKLDPNLFIACSLDEASVLRSYGSKTFQEFLPLFSKVEFKLVATATPSPNRYKELIHYAGFLGVMDTGLALTRWFQRNSEKAGDLTLYPHKEDEFWMWVHSWAAFLQRPSELGYSDEGYEFPPLDLKWHEVPADHSKATPERDGQGVMFRNVASSLQDAAKSRRDSLDARIAKMVEIIAQDPDSHRVIWHDLEAEREAIEQALPGVVTIVGSMDIDDREERLRAFEEGETRHFATKPILSGSGSNFQYHCHKAIYVGMPGDGYKFNDFIQSIYRLQRFGQQFPVEVDIIYSEDMRAGRATLEQKWALDTEMRKRMSAIILAHGLNTLPLRDALARTIGVQRVEIRGQNFIAINNDCVAECRSWPDNSVDQIITSIPFSNHYEYSASYNDFGHTDDNGHFWGQMDFLTAELLRMLKPGRLACIHVKDRVLFGSVTGAGFSTVSSFHEEAVMHYKAHGFWKMGMIHIDTDVVKENADGSYRLGWSENCKDSTTKGVGSPEYVLIMRKGQSDRTRGYADVPVVKEKWDGEGLPADEIPNDGYSRARWQIDAHAFWRSSGNRLLTADEFAGLPAQTLRKIFAKVSSERIYDYEAHVQIGERLERVKDLPAQWSCLAPGATNENTWHDVIRMHTLNSKQVQQGREKHICPLQFDIVDRLINRYSNEGDLILDPFGGIGTVAYRAMLKKRRGAIIELSAQYFLDAVDHCRAAESKLEVPQLFDLATFDAINTPPHGHDGD